MYFHPVSETTCEEFVNLCTEVFPPHQGESLCPPVAALVVSADIIQAHSFLKGNKIVEIISMKIMV